LYNKRYGFLFSFFMIFNYILVISKCKQIKWNSSIFLSKAINQPITEDCIAIISALIKYIGPLIHFHQSMKKEAAIIRLVIFYTLTDFRQPIWVLQALQSRIKLMTRKQIGSWDSFKRRITIYNNKMTVWLVQYIHIS